ncbi:MAG: 16S rRNA (cytosine(1402)-N(4))-methyltransferase RsmH [Planctomycetes bacterium]|nr:16S rRNA (cytosine(1402)-N(4))-methyltransferase RsmH [Planctomycetota bacterium]
MSEPDPNAAPGPTPHRRRPRYKGTHPRRFEEKYKELAAEQYPEAVRHVLARGQTPAGQHVPILVEEVLSALVPKPGERGVDATLGFGGHAQRLLERIAPSDEHRAADDEHRAADDEPRATRGALLALDQDPLQLPRTVERLAKLGFGADVLHARRTNFAALGAELAALGWNDGADFVFADLGVSSMQIDDPARGFTFKHDGPLDMRMNPKKGLSAAQWLARAAVEELAQALTDDSDEPHALRIARFVKAQRNELTTTVALAECVREALAGRADDDAIESSVRRVFQALRIEVNDEFGALEALLRQLPSALRAGGRVAVLTFHSGEDRRVKQAFERGAKDGVYAAISDAVVRASPAEHRANPRSAPAKLRWARRA